MTENTPRTSVGDRIAAAISLSDPFEKAAQTRALVADFQKDRLALQFDPSTLPAPATRERPPLLPPGDMPKRGLGSRRGRAALLHAICHIELNAIDLALDMAGRFTATLQEEDRPEFAGDWLSVADDEARHFLLIADRLDEMGYSYGDFPAHRGLWDAAERTEHDVLARLAIAPMVLEARGLDVTPGMIEKLNRNGDPTSAAALEIIYAEEVGHVATGTRWFRRICGERHLDPTETFASLVAIHFPGGLKPPFNHDARERSDFPRDWYEGLDDLPSNPRAKS